MAIVTKYRINLLQQTIAFNKYAVFAVHEYVGDGGIAEQWFQRTETEDLIEQIFLNSFLLVEAERHLLVSDDLVDHGGDRLPRLAGVDARQLLKIQLGDQGPMYIRFELLKAQLFHSLPSISVIAKNSLSTLTRTSRTAFSCPSSGTNC